MEIRKVLCFMEGKKFGNNEPKIIKSLYPLNFNMVLEKCLDKKNLRKGMNNIKFIYHVAFGIMEQQ